MCAMRQISRTPYYFHDYMVTCRGTRPRTGKFIELGPSTLNHSHPLILSSHFVIVIVIVNSKLQKPHSKTKPKAPAYSRALRQIRGFFQRIVRERLRSGGQRMKGCVKSEGFSKA